MRIIKPNWVKHEHKGTNLSIFAIDIHPDGSRFATGGQGNDCGRVAIWSMSALSSTKAESDSSISKLLCQLDNHLQCVNTVRWSHSGQYLASAGDDKLIMIWTLGGRYGQSEQYRTVTTLRSHSGDILDVSWSFDDQLLASCSVDNMIVVWNTQRWPEIATILKGHSGLVKGVTWDPIGKYLASQSDDKTLRIWRISDWSEEVVIKEPFEQCGGTTHVLRLSWSPDGQFLVSAQAMNNCGSVAKIIERHDWSSERDFVGHRKAIPCVRFNPNIFKYFVPSKKKTSDESGATPIEESKFRPQSLIAVGSRDRSISIWTTAKTRPILVVSDIFQNSVLDLSWSRSGYQLLACSSDGTVIYLEFSEKELGLMYSEEERFQYLQQLYGNSFSSTNKNSNLNRLIEDIDILVLQKQTTNGVDETHQGVASTAVTGQVPSAPGVSEKSGDLSQPSIKGSGSASSQSPKSNQSRLAKGPTDKQIEIRSADGRRRIIPLFIPPSSGGAEQALGTNQNSMPGADSSSTSATGSKPPISFSSSSESKSKIVIETRDESNPGNPSIFNNSIPNGQVSTPVKSEKEDNKVNDVNMVPTTAQDTVNVVSNHNHTVNESKPKIEGKDGDKQKPPTVNGTNGNSKSSDDSSDEDIIRRPAKRKNTSDSFLQDKPVKRKPGRPPGSGTKQNQEPKVQTVSEVLVKPSSSVSNVLTNGTNGDKPQISSTSHSAHKVPPTIQSSQPSQLVFPPLKLGKQNNLSVKLFIGSEDNKTYTASIEYPLSSSGMCKFNLLADGELSWNTLISHTIQAVSANDEIVVCVCDDLTLTVFETRSGRRIYLPILLESPVSRMACCNRSQLLVITCNARIWLWDVATSKVLVKGESLAPLLSDPRTSQQLSILSASVTSSSKPLVTISNGRSYIFDSDLTSWCLLTDLNDPLNACTDLKPCALSSVRSLSTFRKLPSRSLLNFFSSNTPLAQHGLISFIEQQIEVARMLASSKDYRYWTLTLAQNLVSLHSAGFNTDNIESRLRNLCQFLLGSRFPKFPRPSNDSPPTSATSRQSSSNDKILGIDRHELLREVLSVLTSNLALQRLCLEFKDQLDMVTTGGSLSTISKASAMPSNDPSLPNCDR